ncbi:aminotransferase class V-fold PLP-dependent enzyme [Alteromonas sp. ASW11-19]|uniref:Aminotransferase class V-fold PLP-dependent enzyme n=1 Tax=Alteromonas salexigens TaxID=2982530 RepID=A0ABT2VJ40_9ALTE|nr:aminotransferase class V-fold PLP-dependent enzyme [Alteromonas salexigens]MCU7553233.1 aminotransferase class V-fold PLP-dependent enzyme [Alteromonas salexigens]
MYQQYYQRFLKANAGKQHFSPHSHYYWPDVTRQAMLDYWDDSARLADQKWAYFFEDCVPGLQQHISRLLGTQDPEQIVFAPNTHELLFRILSCKDWTQSLRILSTDAEFHSFYRQANRLAEMDTVSLNKVPAQPFQSFSDRFIEAIQGGQYDVIFLSHVFFNSGFVVSDIERIVDAVADQETLVVIDGYHHFMARPTDISAIQDRVFYLAGGYKYAQGGEGACFVHVPKPCKQRPLYTGWYAEFGQLDQPRDGQVQYSEDGMRFAGATMDFSPLYRLRAVLDLFSREDITPANINAHVMKVQEAFLSQLDTLAHPMVNRQALLVEDATERGHFLTFELPDAQTTATIAQNLERHHIMTDYRGNRLRFGFALYHSPDQLDISALSSC